MVTTESKSPLPAGAIEEQRPGGALPDIHTKPGGRELTPKRLDYRKTGSLRRTEIHPLQSPVMNLKSEWVLQAADRSLEMIGELHVPDLIPRPVGVQNEGIRQETRARPTGLPKEGRHRLTSNRAEDIAACHIRRPQRIVARDTRRQATEEEKAGE
jgi:hypothetical protein